MACQGKCLPTARCPAIKIHLGWTLDDLFRDARHVVTSNKRAGRTSATAINPLLEDEREGELMQANLGVVHTLGSELLAPSSRVFDTRQQIRIESIRYARVLMFMRMARAVVLIRCVKYTRRTTLGAGIQTGRQGMSGEESPWKI